MVYKRKSYEVWINTYSIAKGVSKLEIDGSVIKNSCWLQSVEDMQHINITELNAILEGINFHYSGTQWSFSFSQTLHVCISRYDTLTGKSKGGK